MRVKYRACSFPILLLLTGCCADNAAKLSAPISLSDGLALIEHDLAKSGPVVLSDVNNGPAAQPGGAVYNSIGLAIKTAQCLNNSANPPVPVISGPISVALTGSFTSTPSGQISWSATGPGAQLGFQVAVAQTQGLTIPVTFVSALSLPTFYLGQNLSMLSGFDPKDPAKVTLVKQITTAEGNLNSIVNDAVKAFPGNRGSCPKTLDKAVEGPFIPAE